MRKPSGQINDMRLLTTLILVTICLAAIGQTSSTRNWVDSEVKYTDSIGKVVIVHSSLPKGGGGYLNLDEKKYSYVIFWARLINESTSPVELAVKFSAEPFAIFPSPDSHMRIFLPRDTMTLDKVQLGDYGLINLQSLVDAGHNKPTMLQRTINPYEECLFYIVVFLHEARGTARSALVVKGQDLFYKISVGENSALIPCGQVAIRK